MPKGTHRVSRRTHQVCPKTQWGSVSSLLRNSTLQTVFRPFPTVAGNESLEFRPSFCGSGKSLKIPAKFPTRFRSAVKQRGRERKGLRCRETTSAIPPYRALWGFGCLKRACEVEVRYPPHKRGISAILARHHMKTGQNACDTPLCDTISKGYCATWGWVSRAGPLRKSYQKFRLRKWPISSADFPMTPNEHHLGPFGEKDFGAISGGPFFYRPLCFTAEYRPKVFFLISFSTPIERTDTP